MINILSVECDILRWWSWLPTLANEISWDWYDPVVVCTGVVVDEELLSDMIVGAEVLFAPGSLVSDLRAILFVFVVQIIAGLSYCM